MPSVPLPPKHRSAPQPKGTATIATAVEVTPAAHAAGLRAGAGTVARERFQLKGASPSRVGLRFDPRMAFEDWRDLGARLGMHATASVWWLGDWLVFGQYNYDRRYRRATRLTRLDYQTLRNYATVSRRFELSRRRDTLSFQHHAEVCALSDEKQDEWLDRAEAGGWSRNELRRRLRKEDASLEAAAILLRISIEPDRERLWRDAATRDTCELKVWMVRVLDDAARSVLSLS